MASTTSGLAAPSSTSQYFPLATEFPCTGNDCDTPVNGGNVDTAAGAAGSEAGAVGISRAGMTAIIVVVSVIGALGIAMAILFYVSKKREWKIRESIRRSARRVVTALTPRRTEFPKSVKDSSPSRKRSRGGSDEVPPTPRLRPEDVEKGLKSVHMEKKGTSKWGRSER